MINVKLVVIGNLKYNLNFNYFKKRKSFLFNIIPEISKITNLEDAEGQSGFHYPDAQLNRLIRDDNNCDIIFAIGNFQLDCNYYLRIVRKNVAILSLFETGDLLRDDNLKIEDFIILRIYELTLIYLMSNNQLTDSAYDFAHDNPCGCLFDMNSYKPDIIISTSKPILCNVCKNSMNQSQLNSDVQKKLEKELKKIHKSLYFRIFDFIKSRPIISIIISSLFAIILGILSEYVYDLMFK